ncbi:hypothetical protein [Rhodococcus sp. JVH1]|uniref:hypothetical protein n=1 Tax=Rhodococcus sp. JVH1 TaxID=745408 RepID=UPI0002720D19|nr:hypothetical protein [Rhodococcus sp. JVH1]EJJ01044.1 hypothetical protein JVH1_1670 [Rhodococcus sp. JVH1]
MPGENKKNEARTAVTESGPAPFPLDSLLAVGQDVTLPPADITFAPVLVEFGGVTTYIRRSFTGLEVIAASKLLHYTPPPHPIASLPEDEQRALSQADRTKLSEKFVKDVEEKFNQHMVAQLESITESGDATKLWEQMKDLPEIISDRLFRGMYRIAGLVNEQGKFLAL